MGSGRGSPALAGLVPASVIITIRMTQSSAAAALLRCCYLFLPLSNFYHGHVGVAGAVQAAEGGSLRGIYWSLYHKYLSLCFSPLDVNLKNIF